MKKILFIGAPGSGKGTQAKLLEKYGFKHISTGDLIRKAWENNDELLMPHKQAIEKGGLLQDELIFDLIQKNTETDEKYILDGAVRTLNQAKFAIEKNLIDTVVYFSLTKNKSVERLKKRRGVENRLDDSEDAIKKRFEIYKSQTEPVLNYLKNSIKNYFEIDASPSIQEINKEVIGILGLKK